MKEMNQIIHDVLRTLNANVWYNFPPDNAKLPAICYTLKSKCGIFADDGAYINELIYQVTVWAVKPDTVYDLADKARYVLDAVGCVLTDEVDGFEKDVYKRVMTFSAIV